MMAIAIASTSIVAAAAAAAVKEADADERDLGRRRDDEQVVDGLGEDPAAGPHERDAANGLVLAAVLDRLVVFGGEGVGVGVVVAATDADAAAPSSTIPPQEQRVVDRGPGPPDLREHAAQGRGAAGGVSLGDDGWEGR